MALNQLVEKIRALHPGAYDDMDDATLTKAVLEKYPQYSDLAAPPAAGPHVQMEEMAGTQSLTAPAHGAGSLGPGMPEATPGMWKAGITGLSTVPAVLSGGASVPVQSAVFGLTGAAQSKLEGGSNKDAAVSGAIGAAIPGAGALAKKAASYLPSAARAGQALQEVKSVAGEVPIDTAKAGNSALELYTQSQRGATLPKVVNNLVRRLTAPEGAPITYAEAKDFQSNISSLSANEKMNLKPNTVRLLGQLNADLKDALESAADTEGKGQQFANAMKEYHSAMKLRGYSEAAISHAWKVALGYLGAKEVANIFAGSHGR